MTWPQLRNELSVFIELILAQATCRSTATDRRLAARYPFPYPIRLTPCKADGTADDETSIFVVGKHLSAQGLDFYSRQPLPFRQALVCFETEDHEPVTLRIELTWCRFCRHGWYENGGRFAVTP